jgi:hypothetical protein
MLTRATYATSTATRIIGGVDEVELVDNDLACPWLTTLVPSQRMSAQKVASLANPCRDLRRRSRLILRDVPADVPDIFESPPSTRSLSFRRIQLVILAPALEPGHKFVIA